MKSCYCSLAGTNACYYCKNGPSEWLKPTYVINPPFTVDSTNFPPQETEKGKKMEIDYRRNVHVPFEFCGKCNVIEPTTETLFSIDGEPYISRIYCEHAEICKNVVELMTSEKGERKAR